MGVLYDLKRKVDEEITKRKMDEFGTRGQIALKIGFMLSLVDENTPDDPAKVEKLKKAMKEVLGI